MSAVSPLGQADFSVRSHVLSATREGREVEGREGEAGVQSETVDPGPSLPLGNGAFLFGHARKQRLLVFENALPPTVSQ